MEVPFFVRGDPLPELGPLTEDFVEAPSRGLLWGVDLTKCQTRKQVRAVWKDALSGLKEELDFLPELSRICLACSRPQHISQNKPVRMPEGLALRLHNDLERDRGSYVHVLALDITGCSNAALLRERLCEALVTPVRWRDLTLTWHNLADSKVVDAWARVFL